MGWEPREGSGSLFRVREKRNEKGPDFTGDALVNGKKHRLAAWTKQGRNGEKFLSLKIELDTRGEEPQPASPQDDDTEIPF